MKAKLAAALAASVFSLFLAEGVLLVAGFTKEPPLPAAHAPRHTLERQDLESSYTIRTNSLGVRYPEIPLKKPAGETRVVVLGDSFTEGKGVEAEHTFPAYLETLFAAAPSKTRFINCGLIGAGPASYARILRDVGLRYEPDLVLVTLYANDIADTPVLSEKEMASGEGWLIPKPKTRRGPRAFLHRLWPRLHTLAVRAKEGLKKEKPVPFIESVIREAREKGMKEERIEEWLSSLPRDLASAADEGRFDGYMLAHGLVRPDIWLESLDLEGPGRDKWKAADAILSKIASLCEKQGVPVALIFAPAPFQYDPTYTSPSAGIGARFRREWLTEESAFERNLSAWASSRQLPFLNMTLAFRSEATRDPGSLNFKLDPHWTPAGNKLAADVIAEWLKKERLLD